MWNQRQKEYADELNAYKSNLKFRSNTFTSQFYNLKGKRITKKHWNYHYYNNKKLDWWMERASIDHRIRGMILPEAIEHIKLCNLITDTESESLYSLIRSPDQENWAVAISIIIKYKKQIKKQKLNAYSRKT